MTLHVVQAVRSDTFAGVERYVTDVSIALAELGHRVSVIGGDLGQRLPPEVQWVPAATTKQVWRGLVDLGGAGQSGGPDVVHVHMSAAEAAAVAARPWHRAPIVATRHFAKGRGAAGPRRAMLRVMATQLAVEIAISEFVAAELGKVNEPTTVIANGVPNQLSTERPRDAVVLSMSRMEPEKDLATLIEGWSGSRLRHLGWRLLIAGRGSQGAALQARAADLGCMDSIEFLGFVAEPLPLLQRVSALVATATAEPFGLSVAEAMSVGTAVIASAGGAHPELLGPDAWTFEPGNPVELAAQLDRLATPEGFQEYGQRLRQRQHDRFSVTTHVDVLLATYDQFIRH